MGTRLFGALIAAALLYSPAALADMPLIGLTWGGDLYDINPTTGAASNPRSTGYFGLIGIADGSDGASYVISTGLTSLPNALLRVDAETGATQYVGDTGEPMAEGDLDFDPLSGVLFATHPTSGPVLLTVDTITGDATRVGSVPGAGDLSAMAFTNAGSLFMLDTTQDVLFEVDPSDASVISSVTLNHNFQVVAGMDFHPDTGVLYVADGDLNVNPVSLYTLDVSTGNAAVVGPVGNIRGIVGLRFVPEPTSAALLVLGALITHRRNRRRRLPAAGERLQ